MIRLRLALFSCLLVACAGAGGEDPNTLDTVGSMDGSDSSASTEGSNDAQGSEDDVPMDGAGALTPDAVISPDTGGPDALAPLDDVTEPVPSPDVSEPSPDADAPVDHEVSPPEEDVETGPVTLGGGMLFFELASEFLDRAGAGARFTDPVPLVESETVHGPCAVTDADPDAPTPTPAFGYDAGEIVVTGTTPTVTLSPVDEGATGTGYESGLAEDLESLLPTGGALLSITAAGGADIPAFAMHVQVPEPVLLTAPTPGLFASVSASSDLSVSWKAGNGEVVLVTMTPSSTLFEPIAGKGLVCTESGDSGAMVIPAAALLAVKGSGVDKVLLGVTRIKTGETTAGPWGVPAAVTRSTGGPIGLD
jgi:hypothetical protein